MACLALGSKQLRAKPPLPLTIIAAMHNNCLLHDKVHPPPVWKHHFPFEKGPENLRVLVDSPAFNAQLVVILRMHGMHPGHRDEVIGAGEAAARSPVIVVVVEAEPPLWATTATCTLGVSSLQHLALVHACLVHERNYAEGHCLRKAKGFHPVARVAAELEEPLPLQDLLVGVEEDRDLIFLFIAIAIGHKCHVEPPAAGNLPRENKA